MSSKPLNIYADPELGAYGYTEKPWYQPGVRLAAFLTELDASGLAEQVRFCSGGPARDADLQLFHTAAHIASVRSRCARNEGSLDNAVPPLIDDARRLLAATLARSEPNARAIQETVERHFVPAMSFDTYVSYLAGEGLLTSSGETLSVTPAGREFLASATPRLSGPTLARQNVETAATWVCGAVLHATRRILAGEVRRCFVPIAGFHHAHANEARLYCLYNDPGLALAWALGQLDGPVAYIDIDIHHGDGVYEAFKAEPRVIIADLHEDPSTLFPYTPDAPGQGAFHGRANAIGEGPGAGSKLNIPLAPATTDSEYRAYWERAEAFVRAGRPQFVVFEAGVDGLATDPMSNQNISVAAIAHVARRVRALADELCDGRLLVLGGGGYELASTARSWVSVVRALLDA